MKRGGPLARKTPLVAKAPLRTYKSLLNNTALVTRVPLRCRTPITPVSAKRLKANRARTDALRPLREAQPWCSKCGRTGAGLDGHELLSRARGGSITDVANIVLLCRDCHTWVTDNPADAETAGWVFRREAIA